VLILIVLLIALFPLSAFAESPTVNQPTIVVIPDGHGSVQYRRMPYGLDPLTALAIGEGLSQIGRSHIERTPSALPPLTVPEMTPRSTYNDQAVHDVVRDFINSR
jgi:hypothetical protein